MIPLWKEVEFYKEYIKRLQSYLGEERANEILTEAVYLVSIGTNDFLENYYLLPTTKLCYTVPEFQDHLLGIAKDFVYEIYRYGARKLSLAGLPPMGCLPLERTINLFAIHECNEEYNNVALEFNGKMKNLVNQLNKELPGIHVVFSNPYYLVRQMVKKPSLFGKLSFNFFTLKYTATFMNFFFFFFYQKSFFPFTQKKKTYYTTKT